MPGASGGETDHAFYCSFCDKSNQDVKRLIAGPNVFICNECAEICLDVLADHEVLTKPDHARLADYRKELHVITDAIGRIQEAYKPIFNLVMAVKDLEDGVYGQDKIGVCGGERPIPFAEKKD